MMICICEWKAWVKSLLKIIISLRFSSMTLLLLQIGVMRVGSCCIYTLFSLFFLDLFNCSLFGVIAISFKQLFYTLFSKKETILVLLFFLTWWRDLILIVITIKNIDRNEWWLDMLFEHLNPRKPFEPWMVFNFNDPVLGAKPLGRLSLNHLNIWGYTLLTKSAASIDHPCGTSSDLTKTCLLSIWSLIYFLFLP